jgi:L-ornithine Nalpha-acyltransferase
MDAALLGITRRTIDRGSMSGIKTSAPALSATAVARVLGRIATLEVRLADSFDEVAAAQELRFKVFYDELGARHHEASASEARDQDRFDAVCDHLLVVDTAIAGSVREQIVGTYRLLRAEHAERAGGFYSAEEYEVEALIARKPGRHFLELGRSCVLPEYRSKRTVELLWQGIWAYCRRHGIDVMLGCASFQGTTPAAHALPLSFLHYHCRATPDWDVRALPHRYRAMDLMPREAVSPKAALMQMPPLIKGYLRLGASIGDGAVIDRDFGTTDVFIILPVENISSRYISYYGQEADRFV